MRSGCAGKRGKPADGSMAGQVSLEVGFAMIAAFVLIMGSVVLFGWLNSRLVYRQEAFETGSTGRKAAGTTWDEVQVDENKFEKLDIFDW